MTEKKTPLLITVPTIDSLFAIALKLEFLGKSPDDVEIHFSPETLPDGEAEEVDAIDRYRMVGKTSATEVVIDDCGANVFTGHVVKPLLQAFADNNGMGASGKGGYLKKLPLSFADLIRDMPYFAHNISSDDHLRRWIREFSRVPAVYLKTMTYELTLDPAAFEALFPDIASEIGESFWQTDYASAEAFVTLPGYLVALAGTMTEEDWKQDGEARIRQEYVFWKEAFRTASNVHLRARERAKEIKVSLERGVKPCRYFDLGDRRRGAFVQCDNQLVARYLWPQLKKDVVALVIREQVRGEDGGHICLQTKTRSGLDLLRTYQALANLEPEAWYYEDRFGSPMLLNASAKIPNRPRSVLAPEGIIKVLKETV